MRWLEAGAIAELLRTSSMPRRQSGHCRACELVALDADRSRRRDRLLRGAADRPGRDRPRSAAGRWAWPIRLRAPGFPVFGPSKAAAQLEGSKGFTKDLCERAGIPTAGYVAFTESRKKRWPRWRASALPVVIKADGLAAGKGVTVAMTRAEAEAAVATCSTAASARPAPKGDRGVHDRRGSQLLRPDRWHTIVPFGSAQDHKRVGDGDTGPNTGGMGAYSPARVLTPDAGGRSADGADHRAPRCGHGGRGQCPIRACSTPG
jgi:hypothetical protein